MFPYRADLTPLLVDEWLESVDGLSAQKLNAVDVALKRVKVFLYVGIVRGAPRTLFAHQFNVTGTDIKH